MNNPHENPAAPLHTPAPITYFPSPGVKISGGGGRGNTCTHTYSSLCANVSLNLPGPFLFRFIT